MEWLGLFLAVCLASAQAAVLQSRGFFIDENKNKSGGRTLKFFTGNNTITVGHLGLRTSLDAEGVTFKWKSLRDEVNRDVGITIEMEGKVDTVFRDCFEFGPYSASPKNILLSKGDHNAAVSERHWLSSSGIYYYVYPEVPLFTEYSYSDSFICFTSEVTAPYTRAKRTRSILKYDIWFFDDPKEGHKHAVKTFMGTPSDLPDQRMIQFPVWSTFARYSKDIDRDSLWTFANEIKDNDFQNAQLQIDDGWESCYGSLTVDEKKLPNFKELIQDIKKLGFRVSLWVHPFINKDCDPWYSEALEKGYLVLNEEGSPDTSWWNSNDSVAGYIDFTNPEAAEWFTSRVQSLIDTYDIDTFTFDAGESSWSPQIPVQTGDIELHPSHIVSSYVQTVARFGNAIEVRSGMRTQNLPIFTRMSDKYTWSEFDGQTALIPSLLQMNLNGYTLVSPSVIGGIGEPNPKGIFIRWLQATVFMPTLKFGVVPWDYDQETVEICLRYTELHAAYAADIMEAIRVSMRDGSPVNAPVWWVDPTDREALTITDEYLLGTNILVAPVLQLYATSRDIYLPKGTWYEYGDPTKPHRGPIWLKKFQAPLDVLPYFVKDVPNGIPPAESGAATAPSMAGVLVLLVAACGYMW